MNRIFYEVAPGSAAWCFCDRFADALRDKQRQYSDYAASKGAEGWTMGFHGISGLIFPFGATVPTGFKKERKRTSDGRDYFTPHGKSEAGRAIRIEMVALGLLPRQSEFAKHFGIPTGLQYSGGGDCINGATRLTCGGIFESSLIAWPKPGHYWVVLPDIDAEIAALQERGHVVQPSTWVLPEGLTKSTEARFELAVALTKVENEDD